MNFQMIEGDIGSIISNMATAPFKTGEREVRIGVGLTKPASVEERRQRCSLVQSLEQAQSELDGIARVFVFADYATSKKLKVTQAQDPIGALIKALKEGEIDIAIRGTLADHPFYAALAKESGVSLASCFDVAIMRNIEGNCWLALYPVDNPDGHSLKRKIEHIMATAQWIQKTFGIKPSVGIMTGGSEASRANPFIDATWGDAELLKHALLDAGIQAEICAHRLEKALIEGNNVIVPVNGFVGNQIFRALHYLANWQLVGAPRLYVEDGGVFLLCCDCSAYEESFYHHVFFALACSRSEGT